MALTALLDGRLRLPAIAAPMFIASGPQLVLAQCRAGVVGSLPALNARPTSMLGDWLDLILEELSASSRQPESVVAPYAVNLIVHRSNDRLDHDLGVVVERRVPIVITSLGARPEVNEAVHSYGGVVLHDVTTNSYARKAIEKGADGLIAVAAGAGGHAGTLSPFALTQEIRSWFDGPLLLAGSIAHGRSVLAAQAAGADLAYIGSAFLATWEANVQDAHLQMVLDSTSEDIVYTDVFSGIHGNYLRGSIEAAGLGTRSLPTSLEDRVNFGSNPHGAKVWRDIWGCGQGIGLIDRPESVAELVDRLARQYMEATAQLCGRFALGCA